MRTTLMAAILLAGVAACSQPKAPEPAASAAAGGTPSPTTATSTDMSNMPGMNMGQMASSAAKDAGPMQLTSNNHMFHVMQGTKEEKVVLPASGSPWTPDKPAYRAQEYGYTLLNAV